MNYEVVQVEFDEEDLSQIKISLRRDKVSGDSEKNDYHRIHINYVPFTESSNYWVGKMMVLS